LPRQSALSGTTPVVVFRRLAPVDTDSERHVRRLVASGQLRAVRSGNVVRVPFAELERFVTEQLEGEAAEAS
jgi:excisionase family DNA binding protein